MDKGVYFDPENAQSNVNNSASSSAVIIQKTSALKMDKKDSAFVFLFFAWCVMFVDFSVMHGFNLGFSISFAVLFALVTAYLFKKGSRPSVFSCLCGILSLAGAATLTLFRDVFINFIMVFLVTALFTVYTCGISQTFRNKQGSYKMLLDLLSGAFVAPLANAPKTFSAFGKSALKNKKILQAAIGIGISIPVLIVLIPLLISSDAAFEGLVKAVAKNIGMLVADIIIAIIITPFVVSYMYSKKRNLKTCSEFYAKDHSGMKFVPQPISVSFLSVISATYLVYLFSQLAYFFSAFSGILPEGYEFTPSEYARRGFFEMFAICVINIIILSLISILTKRKKNKGQSVPVKLLGAFISLFTVVLIVTAMSKMKLYIDIYGLTKYRLLVSVFMVMLLVIIAFFALHIFAPKISYMQPIIIICSAMFIALSFADIDKLIAKYDIEAYQSGKIETIDVEYLGELSSSSVEDIIALAKGEDKKLAEFAQAVLYQKINYDYCDLLVINDKTGEMEFRGSYDFRDFNASTYKAVNAIAEYYNSLDEAGKKRYSPDYYNDRDYEYYYDEKTDTEYYDYSESAPLYTT